MSQDDIDMTFNEPEDRREAQFDPLLGSEEDSSTSYQMTPFKTITQALPLNSLGTSESMSELPVTTLDSLSLPSEPLPLMRAISTSPQFVHVSSSPCSTDNVAHEAEDLSSPSIYPLFADVLMSTSVPISIPFPHHFRQSSHSDALSTFESTSVPNDSYLHHSVPGGINKSSNGQLHKNPNSQATEQHNTKSEIIPIPRGSRLSITSVRSCSHFRPSLFGSSVFGSPEKKISSRSLNRLNIVTDSMSMCPSFVSDISINDLTDFHDEESQNKQPQSPAGKRLNAVLSCQSNLNHLDNTSTQNGDIDPTSLQRSSSVPIRCDYNNQMNSKNQALRDIFTDLQNKVDTCMEKEAGDEVGDLLVSMIAAKRKFHLMPDLIESPENETLTSQSSTRVLLANAARDIACEKGYDGKEDVILRKQEELQQIATAKRERRRYLKNIFVLCLSFFFIFTSYLALRNLQSSINAKGGLGMYAFSALYACFFIGCIFATTIVQRLRPKWSMLVCFVGISTYDIANFYPNFYTLVPTSGVVGFSLGVIWTAHATYISNVAVGYADLTGEKLGDILVKFNGIHFAFYQLAQIIGGLLSSFVLNNPPTGNSVGANYSDIYIFENNSNTTTSLELLPGMRGVLSRGHCGIDYCPSKSSSSNSTESEVDSVMVYTLLGIFSVCSVVGIIVLLLFLDRLEGVMKKKQTDLGKQLSAVFRFYANRKVVCLVGIMFYSMLQSSFMFGEFTKSFVTCSLGIHMVGFIMVCFSASSGVASFTNGRVQKLTGRCPLIITGIASQAAMLVTIYVWQPSPDRQYMFFIVSVFWGIGDGIIVAQTISVIGTMFPDNKEPAFAALKMTQSAALFLFFVTSQYLCTSVKVIVVFLSLVVGAVGYVLLEIKLYFDKKETGSQTIKTAVGEVKAMLGKDKDHSNKV